MSSKKKKASGELSWSALKREWLAWYSGKSPIFIFGLKFGLMMLLLYGLLDLPFCEKLLVSYLHVNAVLANQILNLMGQHSQISDVTISSPKFAMAIRRGCDAVEPTWLFCAAIAAFPSTWWRKLVGMSAGIVLLQVLNLVRIVSLYFIGTYCQRPIFDMAHLEIWPTVFILVAILLWVGWMEWTKRYA